MHLDCKDRRGKARTLFSSPPTAAAIDLGLGGSPPLGLVPLRHAAQHPLAQLFRVFGDATEETDSSFAALLMLHWTTPAGGRRENMRAEHLAGCALRFEAAAAQRHRPQGVLGGARGELLSGNFSAELRDADVGRCERADVVRVLPSAVEGTRGTSPRSGWALRRALTREAVLRRSDGRTCLAPAAATPSAGAGRSGTPATAALLETATADLVRDAAGSADREASAVLMEASASAEERARMGEGGAVMSTGQFLSADSMDALLGTDMQSAWSTLSSALARASVAAAASDACSPVAPPGQSSRTWWARS